MEILTTLSGSSQEIAPEKLNQIINATNDELQKCLVALKKAHETIETSLQVKAILIRFEEDPPRQRPARIRENAGLVSSNWQSFHGWSAGRLHRLLLSTKPDVIWVIAEGDVRDCLRDRMTETPVSNGLLTTLRKFLPDGTPLIQILAAAEEEDRKRADTQRTYSVHEERPLSVPQKRDWPFGDSVDFEIDQSEPYYGIQQTSTDADYTLNDELWEHSIPYDEFLT